MTKIFLSNFAKKLSTTLCAEWGWNPRPPICARVPDQLDYRQLANYLANYLFKLYILQSSLAKYMLMRLYLVTPTKVGRATSTKYKTSRTRKVAVFTRRSQCAARGSLIIQILVFIFLFLLHTFLSFQ